MKATHVIVGMTPNSRHFDCNNLFAGMHVVLEEFERWRKYHGCIAYYGAKLRVVYSPSGDYTSGDKIAFSKSGLLLEELGKGGYDAFDVD